MASSTVGLHTDGQPVPDHSVQRFHLCPQAATKKQKYEKISEKKMSTPVEVLCKVCEILHPHSKAFPKSALMHCMRMHATKPLLSLKIVLLQFSSSMDIVISRTFNTAKKINYISMTLDHFCIAFCVRLCFKNINL